MTTKVLLLLSFLSVSLAQEVVTPDGPIRGVAEQTSEGKTYYAYYTIPYAKPPTGTRRFLASESIDPWTEAHDGTIENQNHCYQIYSDSEFETEDCLYMNVFTPQNPNSTISQNYTVMVYIHGGGVNSGLVSSGIVPNYLVNENVIFVSFNYRIGIFGFLSTKDSVIPGNAGLSDQIQALKWVQRNIGSFGGDPAKVTILGQATGACSVGFLMMSSAASGLFSAAIMVSGSPLVPWSYQRHAKEYAFKTGSFLDAQFESNFNSSALLKTLQEVDAEVIDELSLKLNNSLSSEPDAGGNTETQQGFYYAAVVDSASNNPIIPINPYEAFKNGNITKVPIFIVIVSEEGLMNLNQNLDNLLQNYDNNSGYMVPQAMHIEDQNVLAEVGSLIKQEYSPNSTFINNKLAGIQYFSEQDVDKSSVKHAELQSQFTDVYYFEFSYTGTMGGNTDRKYPGSGNVTHNEDMKYILNANKLSSYPENDQLISRRLVRLWTNFAKYHNPTPETEDLLQNLTWPKVQVDNFSYVRIGDFNNTDLTTIQGKPKAGRIAFWENLYAEYAVEPLDTY